MKWFALETAEDLFEKLKRDHAALQVAPASSDCAFNFFVTARSLLDWKYTDPKVREARRAAEPLLQLLDHLASGLKHFELDNRKHDSLSRTAITGGYSMMPRGPAVYFHPGYFGGSPRRLVVVLDGAARGAFGPTITVGDLAVKVMEFWTAEIQKP